MPNPHYQRVLEQDKQLPVPMRWLTRAMSSWWTILALGLSVVGYVAAAHIPLGGRYLWQMPAFDTTQHEVLTWWPLIVAAWLLAAVVLWAAVRRLPWRIDNLGAFVAVLGLAMILLSQSWAFRGQSVGIAAVPITTSTGNEQADALSLNYTTRYGDTTDRTLVIMVGGAAPITIPFDGLPRWNDATGEAMPNIKLHDNPKLSAAIGFGTRITTSAYLADGTLTETADGTQTATPTPANDRDLTTLPYPSKALLALEITADVEDGGTQTTTAWLPFEPEGTDSLVPKQFFNVEGLGTVGLAFRPASKKLPFALGAVLNPRLQKFFHADLYIADADADGRILKPASYQLVGHSSFNHAAVDLDGRNTTYSIGWLPDIEKWQTVNGVSQAKPGQSNTTLVEIKANATNPFILAGLITFILGVILDRVLSWLAKAPKPEPAIPPL